MEKNQLLIVIIANSVEKFLNKQKSKKKIFEKIEDFNQCPKSQFEECDKQCHS